MSHRLSRSLLAAAAASGLAAALIASGSTSTSATPAPRAVCPRGQVLNKLSLAAASLGSTPVVCVPKQEVESAADGMIANRSNAVKHDGTYPVTAEAYESAVLQSGKLPTSKAYGGMWNAVGKDALNADVAGYTSVNGEGEHNLSGRIQGFAYDPTNTNHYYAAVANGGVWESTNAGSTWKDIGVGLPSQIVGAVEIARNHTLVVGSGDPAFGGDSYSGLGAFWSTDDGKTWNQAKGIPNGTITFKIAVDPVNPSIVYQATGKGLWRSTDSGHSYVNVNLPTTCTSITKPTCFFANIVSDVVVRPAGGNGTYGGEAVMAAVGWRAGNKLNAAGTPQAPRDGIYRSVSGKPNTFVFDDPAASGFPAIARAGRTALGIAYGDSQNHDYVYALVEDPSRFNKQTGVGDLPVAPLSGVPVVPSTLNPTVLNGVYVSKDFGTTWTLMADADQLDAAVHGSALGGTECSLGYCAGVQSWYNEWIQPSPAPNETAEDGTPLFLSFGLEEVWGGSAAVPTVANTSNFGVFGRYFSGTTCAGESLPELQGFCPTTGVTPQGSTVHPDQHAVMYVPSGHNATLVVGNDGGAYKQAEQATQSTTPYDNDHWANGINHDLHTLLPYDAEMSKDGTVYGGLQDNGELKITPQGKQIESYGGDGFFSAVDPNNSKIAYEEYTEGDISVTKDGGMNWTDIQPCYDTAQFATPFLLDPSNANHIVAGGADIEESTAGPNTTSDVEVGLTSQDKNATCGPLKPVVGGGSTDWVNVYSLGTTNGFTNTASAVDVHGASIYAGFCGSCDIVTQGLPFHSGLATNVGGSKPAKEGTSDGWHVAAAKGLPQRIINSVLIDPSDPKTVYVTLGGYGRRWIPPGSLGDNVSKIGEGHVFVSHDAGASFTDISGDLPDLAADFAVLHDGDLIVADDLGVYALPKVASVKSSAAAKYSVVGTGLPKAPVVHLEITPRSRNELLAATYGRGVQVIHLAPGSTPGGPTSGVPGTKQTGTGGKKSTGGKLASTGASTRLAALSLLLLLLSFVVRRRWERV